MTFNELRHKVIADLDGRAACCVELTCWSYEENREELYFRVSIVKDGRCLMEKAPTASDAYERFRLLLLPAFFSVPLDTSEIDQAVQDATSDLS